MEIKLTEIKLGEISDNKGKTINEQYSNIVFRKDFKDLGILQDEDILLKVGVCSNCKQHGLIIHARLGSTKGKFEENKSWLCLGSSSFNCKTLSKKELKKLKSGRDTREIENKYTCENCGSKNIVLEMEIGRYDKYNKTSEDNLRGICQDCEYDNYIETISKKLNDGTEIQN